MIGNIKYGKELGDRVEISSDANVRCETQGRDSWSSSTRLSSGVMA